MVTNTTNRATLTIKETAQMLGISDGTAYKYLYAGSIPALRLGKRWIISKAVIERWLETSSLAVPVTLRERL